MAGYFANSYVTDFDSTKFAAFNELMQDRQAQGYVFPDLRRFSKNTKFEFAANVLAAPTMRNIRNSDPSGVILADTTIPLIVLMQAPRKEEFKYVPYVQWRGNVRGTAMMKIVNGQMAIQMRDAKVELSSGWNQAYLKKYKPNPLIRDEIFADALAESIREEVHMVDLPFWKWGDNSAMSPVEMAIDGERLRIFWEVQEGVEPETNIISEVPSDSTKTIAGTSAAKKKANASSASSSRGLSTFAGRPQITDRAKERLFDGVRSDDETHQGGQQVSSPNSNSQAATSGRRSWLWSGGVR